MLTLLIPNYFKSEQENMNVREVSQIFWSFLKLLFIYLYIYHILSILPLSLCIIKILKEIVLICWEHDVDIMKRIFSTNYIYIYIHSASFSYNFFYISIFIYTKMFWILNFIFSALSYFAECLMSWIFFLTFI
jgi:hypothetical protein